VYSAWFAIGVLPVGTMPIDSWDFHMIVSGVPPASVCMQEKLWIATKY